MLYGKSFGDTKKIRWNQDKSSGVVEKEGRILQETKKNLTKKEMQNYMIASMTV